MACFDIVLTYGSIIMAVHVLIFVLLPSALLDWDEGVNLIEYSPDAIVFCFSESSYAADLGCSLEV